jgi:protein-L-isoaspartate(D-aspartate) O-methyltransferase
MINRWFVASTRSGKEDLMNETQTYRQTLVDHLKVENCITTLLIEQAFLAVPRHLFLPGEPLDKVYADRSIVVRRDAEGQLTSSSSQPAIMAIMLEQLDLKPGQRVLEIGAGTGFNAALIASIVGPGGMVVTMDIQPDLVEHARARLDVAGYEWVQVVVGDGGYGYPDGALYDRIILSVASTVIAPAWREQLALGGRLVLPLELPGGQKSVAFQRRGQELVSTSIKPCGFMPLQGAFARPQPTRVQIGSDPNLCLSLGGERELPISADHFAGWLSESGRDWATGVTTTMGEIRGSFFPWIGVQWPQGDETTALPARLSAGGDLADQNVIPALCGFGGEIKAMHTFVLTEADGGAAMMRPLGQTPPLIDVNHPPADPPAFELYVRQLGPGTDATQHLVERIQDWDRAGRPKRRCRQIRALPAEMAYAPAEGELLLDRKGTKLVISYQ